MKNYLLVSMDTDAVNQPALTTALKGFRTIEPITGTLLIESDVSAAQLKNTLGSIIGEAEVLIVPIDAGAVRAGYWPIEVRDFFGVSQAA